jgi:GTP-binding protein HflX
MSPTESAFTDTLISREFRERIVVVGVTFPHSTPAATQAGLDELALLVDTAGADVAARVVQRRQAPDPATYLGRGKAEELRAVCLEVDADTVVFDDDLTPAQQRNLEKILGRTAIDRTAVILDIFAQNARTPEGRAQVELALLRYRLPRLRGRGHALSQQAGGIGTRGPGETQLEVDRRRLVRRMTRLEADLRQLDRTRRVQRRGRQRGRQRTVSLVGYTNAGKSTLLNRLCAADVLVEDRLFSTLDPRTRAFALPGGETVLLTDTVGFVRKLPHQVVEAFRSTLEVVLESDLIVHVVDGSAPDLEGQIDAVRAVLGEIGATDLPELLVVNKADALRPGEAASGEMADGEEAPGEEAVGEEGSDPEDSAEEVRRLLEVHPGSVLVSARTGEGIDELLGTLGDRLRSGDRVVELVIPWARGDVLAAVHREGEIVGEEAGDTTTRLQVVLDAAGKARFAEFLAS